MTDVMTIERIRTIAEKWYNDQWTGDECMSKIVEELGI